MTSDQTQSMTSDQMQRVTSDQTQSVTSDQMQSVTVDQAWTHPVAKIAGLGAVNSYMHESGRCSHEMKTMMARLPQSCTTCRSPIDILTVTCITQDLSISPTRNDVSDTQDEAPM